MSAWHTRRNLAPIARFMRHVDIGDGPDACWLWKAARTKSGYGRFRLSRKTVRAHRFSYKHSYGAIPRRAQLDHVCRSRACVRPSHLEPVTGSVNCRRGRVGEAIAARERSKTHCANGHPFDAANTAYRRGTRQRVCRICRLEALLRWKARHSREAHRV